MLEVAILSGSAFGAAEEVARHAEQQLTAAGLAACHLPDIGLDALLALDPQALLVVTSTTGMGEVPDDLQALLDEIEAWQPDWRGRPVAVIGLGDSCYGENFCAAALQAHALLLKLGMRDVQSQLQLDASETVTPAEDAEPWLARLAAQLLKLR
ncbi:flavodoxin domain-containing protein [Pseudomonas sp. MAP12]|uniref:Flavodoxin domain-containing protein n=1 Tax=Geopseudomonas aromaticivorans TaxID=2849492 RepID=A0ABS6MY71_9GAMM|nr:flavodoxin domain-containing protein [Pseudomonas aromaticivorans]MBV2133762.1 flavodoxin domain-containing protein [Pseudomonas aromaticivorans]